MASVYLLNNNCQLDQASLDTINDNFGTRTIVKNKNDEDNMEKVD